MNLVFYIIIALLAVSLWFCLRWSFNSIGKNITEMKNEITDILKENKNEEK